jgi:hypothetical protein
MSKLQHINHPIEAHMGQHITEIEITGSLPNDGGMPVELDMFLGDSAGRRFAINIMTVARYEAVKAVEPGMEVDETAPHVFVINEDEISLDSLMELLRAPDIKVFEPYLYTVDET